MASVTLAESAKLTQDELVAGVIENVITTDQFFGILPFDEVEGNALAYNRENALGDVIRATVGTTFSGAGAGKAAATFTKVTSALTTIMGDAEVNGLIQATRSNSGTDQTGTQIASKAKSAGRDYRSQLINGDGTSNSFSGLLTLCASGQKATTGATGSALSFTILDELLDLVLDKDGQVDYILMPARTIRSYKALLRALGGTPAMEAVALASGGKVIGYNNIPIFRNDYIPVNQTKGGTTNCTTIFAGTLDDGSRSNGIAGLTGPGDAAGITVEDVGLKEDADEHIYRVKWYCGLALFNEKGLACADGITN
jgi:hypothetical protein